MMDELCDDVGNSRVIAVNGHIMELLEKAYKMGYDDGTKNNKSLVPISNTTNASPSSSSRDTDPEDEYDEMDREMDRYEDELWRKRDNSSLLKNLGRKLKNLLTSTKPSL